MTIVIGSIIYLVGGALQTGAANIHMLWVGRWLAGVGVGFLVMIIPLYQSEIAHPSIRGRITSLQQFMLGIGAFVAGWISYGTYVGLHNQAQWRLPLGLQMLPAVVLGGLIMFFPESPRVSTLALSANDITHVPYSGSSTTTDQPRACRRWLDFILMATRMIHGSRPNLIRSKIA
jgi:MFS family permease